MSTPVVINFDTLNTSGAAIVAGAPAVAGQPLAAYFASFGVTYSATNILAVFNNANIYNYNQITTNVSGNMLFEAGSETGESYDLYFATPLSSISLDMVGYIGTVLLPQWSITAYDASGNVVGTVGQGLAGYSNVNPQTYTFNATGTDYITRVEVFGDGYDRAAYEIPLFDTIVLTPAAPPALFMTGADTVDFNNLTTAQQAAIAGGADIYHGLGGNDVVTLPNEANYSESVGNGHTLGWTDTAASTFYTGSQPGDTYTVNGGDGDYYIVEGAGTEFITINGDGSSIITAGSGTDNITISGDGDSTITAGSGNEVISISGGGTLDVTGNFVGSATIGANSTLELGGAASGGTITLDPSGTDETLQIDGTTMPTNVISGFVAPSNPTAPGFTGPSYLADTIDLTGVPYDSGGIATLQTSNNQLQINENGETYSLQLDPTANFSGDVFPLSSDGSGGTDVQVLAKSNAGFDLQDYPGSAAIEWLWANTNLSWVGFYLYPAPSRRSRHSQYTGQYEALVTQGWKVAPLYLGYQDPTDPESASKNPPQGQGTKDGNQAAADMDAENVTTAQKAQGIVIYLDVEPFTSLGTPEQEYISEWSRPYDYADTSLEFTTI
jgi:hypothetical protein